jgi:streptogramin lyase
MRCSPVIVVIALAVSGCLGSGAGDDEPPAGACHRPLPKRVEVPSGRGEVPIGGYANLVAAGDGRVWTLVTRGPGGPRAVIGIDSRTGAVTRWPYAGSEEARIRVGGGAVWLADPQSRTLTRFAAATGRSLFLRLFARRGGPREIAVGQSALWAIPAEGGDLAQLDLETGAVRRRLVVSDVDELADVAVAGGQVWLTTGDDGTLLRVSARSGRPLSVPMRLGDETLDVEASAGEAWVDLGDANALAAVDAVTGRVLHAHVPNGGDTFAIALGYGGVWATNYGRATVTRIDRRTGERIGDPLATGADPKGLAIGAGAVWVANAGACTLTRLTR